MQLPTWQDGVALSPTCKLEEMKCDGRFDGELEHGKVTGNHVVSWKPALGDWYETVNSITVSILPTRAKHGANIPMR